jgi:Na+/H+ antiporter NhaD/arsenite permease-like protein
MSTLAADIIGLTGSAIFLAAFAYANVAKQLNKVVFNLANLLGAVLLLISLSVTFNLAAFVLEAAWGTIALAGLLMAIRAKLRKPQP